MTPVLVTGGAGYIGAHICRALADAGLTPVTYDNLSLGHRHSVQFGPFEHGDIADPLRLGTVLDQHAPVAVIHCAARSTVAESNRLPLAYYATNVSGSITLFETLRAHGIDKLVFSSTCATYGLPVDVPIVETTPQVPINSYGRSKLMVECVLADAAAAYGFNAVTLRYFNAAGASGDASVGEEHDPETHLIPLVLAAALDGGTIAINGTDYDTPDGTCVRDYVHVEDLADAHVSAVRALLSGELTGFTGLNLGSGLGISVREIVDTARRVTGRPIAVREGPRRPGDPSFLVANFALAIERIGYTPRHLDIEGIVASAWAFMRRIRG